MGSRPPQYRKLCVREVVVLYMEKMKNEYRTSNPGIP
jgi:hypothetical protein